MRMSPVGLYAFLKGMNLQETLSTAYRVARLTHGHPRATYPSVAVARAIVSTAPTCFCQAPISRT